jgi:poly(A) polymerase
LCSKIFIHPGLTKIKPTTLSPTGHDLSVLDVDAVRAVTRLIDKGYEAYLVGGCVRDLLLDRSPKDYDIATEARPPQVKRTFPRNCRIIGRRFKLAHLHFHGNTKILECSTFRRNPQESEGDDEDLLITRDNEFGNAEEDALRRDFTINALFLDPTRDEIVDHVNGLADIEARVIRTIGEPVVRFREDPVRILRAVKFAGRLGFEVEPETMSAMAETAEDLVRAAPPRLLEEILRLLRSGHARKSFELLQDIDAIQHLVPVVGAFLRDADDDRRASFWSLLGALDDYVGGPADDADPLPNGVLLATLMYNAVAAAREDRPNRSASSVAEELLGSLAVDLRLPRRDSGCLKRACGVQHRFEQDESKRRFRVEGFVESPYFADALLLFELRVRAAEGDLEAVDAWHALAGTDRQQEARPSEDDEDRAPRKKRRRRRRRRRDDEDETEAGEAPSRAASQEAQPESGDDEDEAQAPPARAKRSRRRRAPADDDELSDVTFPAAEDGEDEDADGEDADATDARAEDAAGGDDERDGERDGEPSERRRGRRRRKPGSEAEAGPEGDDGPDLEATYSDVTLEDMTFEDDERDEDEDDEAPKRKRRRRRGRRGRGRKDRDEDEAQEASAGEASDDDGDREQASADGGDRDDGDRDDDGPKRKVRAKKATKKAAKRGGSRRDRKGGDDKREDRKRTRRSRSGVRSDVGVVPRYRDRRGKVEVIEPIAQDLSAFDVELDPKRVPTFGSIVEGKSRPKRRGPRLSDKASDDYRPPPPQQSDDDTFGDW